MKIIEVDHVSKSFNIVKKEEGFMSSLKSLFVRKHESITAVEDISFDVYEGEFVGFIGPNGAGKTTTIKMLSGIIYPSQGSIRVMNFIPQELKEEFKMNFSVIMGQKNQLWWDIPAIDSFLLYKEIYQIPEKMYRNNIDELSELLQVSHVLNIPIRNLSLGERMKLEIIAALLHEPKLLFLDEPTIGLDVFSRRKIRDFLKVINKERKITIILTSHYIEDIKALCSRVIGIHKGKIIYDGPFESISQDLFDSKMVTVTFEYDAPELDLKRYGQLLESNNNKLAFLIKKNMLNEFGKEMFTGRSIIDMNIEDIPVDEVFEKLFDIKERAEMV